MSAQEGLVEPEIPPLRPSVEYPFGIEADVPGLADGYDGYLVAATVTHSLMPISEAEKVRRIIIERVNGWDALVAERARLLTVNATLRNRGQFLLDRLDDFERGAIGECFDDRLRDWEGHVAPALARLRAALAGHEQAGTKRACTCHPDDNPPVPCAEKYAYSECVAAPTMTAEQMRERAAFYHDDQAQTARNSTHCGDSSAAIASYHRVADWHEQCARDIRALPASPGKGAE